MKRNAFTILEMMVVLLIVAILLFITLPNIQQALIEIVNRQILLYEIDEEKTPDTVQELIDQGYLKQGQDVCPNGQEIVIENGQARSQ